MLSYTTSMLFMIIERFKHGNAKLIGERFRRTGRMLPDGVTYHASWIDPAGHRCFQIMEAPYAEALNSWTRHWHDLIEFEIVPVLACDFFSWFGTSSSGRGQLVAEFFGLGG
jgi:Protein of unknown function (DUF3303)